MEFVKGTIIGMIAGACIGYMNNETICSLMKVEEKNLENLREK